MMALAEGGTDYFVTSLVVKRLGSIVRIIICLGLLPFSEVHHGK